MIKVKHRISGKEYSAIRQNDLPGEPFYSIYNDRGECVGKKVGVNHYEVKPTPHPQADVIHAFADGYEIESRHPFDEDWGDDLKPYFSEDYEFRIKPVINEALQEAEEALLAVHVERVELENIIKQLKEDL